MSALLGELWNLGRARAEAAIRTETDLLELLPSDPAPQRSVEKSSLRLTKVSLRLTQAHTTLCAERCGGKLHQTSGLLSDEATKANSETLLREIGSAGGLTEFLLLSDGAAKTKEGANPGDITSPSGDNRATNLAQSQTSTSCLSASCLATFKASASSR
jgi:hypothetical protein